MNKEEHLIYILELRTCSRPSDVRKLIEKYSLVKGFPKESLDRLKELEKIRPWY